VNEDEEDDDGIYLFFLTSFKLSFNMCNIDMTLLCYFETNEDLEIDVVQLQGLIG